MYYSLTCKVRVVESDLAHSELSADERRDLLAQNEQMLHEEELRVEPLAERHRRLRRRLRCRRHAGAGRRWRRDRIGRSRRVLWVQTGDGTDAGAARLPGLWCSGAESDQVGGALQRLDARRERLLREALERIFLHATESNNTEVVCANKEIE